MFFEFIEIWIFSEVGHQKSNIDLIKEDQNVYLKLRHYIRDNKSSKMSTLLFHTYRSVQLFTLTFKIGTVKSRSWVPEITKRDDIHNIWITCVV